MRRILYLALADARGHLMRAHILRDLLGERGVDVTVVTTSRAGQRFLETLGTPSELLSEHFRVEFDARHNMSHLRTDARVAAYLLHPDRCRRDLRRLDALARGADLVVDDSFHPAMLFAHRRFPLVHVYGENMWGAVVGNLDGRAGALARPYRWAMEKLKSRALAHVEHTVSTEGLGWSGNRVRLPPIIPRLRPRPRPRPRPRTRSRTAVVYLNPHFSDPAIAGAIERAARRHGYRLHAVAEGYADRPGWVARDPHLVDAIAGADLFVSGAGMGALGMANLFGVPFLCLLGRQPEQRANVAQLGPRPNVRVVDLPPTGAPAMDADIADLAFRARRPLDDRPDPRARVRALHQQWTDAFVRLLPTVDKDSERTTHVERSAS